MKYGGIKLFITLMLVQQVRPTITFIDQTSTIDVTETATFFNGSTAAMSQITGKLKVFGPESITGNPFFFADGIYSDGTYEVRMTATYDPSSTYSIQMNSGPSLLNFTVPGILSEQIQMTGVTNKIEGLPTLRTPSAFHLLGADAALTLAIQSDLNQNLIMPGTLNVGANLYLADNVTFTGPGTINFNGFNLILGQKELTWTDTFLWVDAQNLVMNSENRVFGQWIFQGDAQIVGNNFTLDLSSGATLRIKSDTTLRLSNIIVSGLGSGQIEFDDTTATLELFNVVFEMNGNYTFTTGTWHAVGPTTVITSNNFLTFDNRATLTVDETTVFYDTLNYLDQNNIKFGSLPINVAYVNGGRIKIVQSLNVGDFRFSYNGNTNQQLDSDFIVTPLRRLIFDATATIDGAGFFYQFARNPNQPILFVYPGVIAKFTDILLEDFPTNDLSVDPEGQLIFGDETQIDLGESGIVTTTWFFEGTTVMNGAGKILQLGTGGSLVLRPGSSLLLDNMTIRGLTGSNIYCMDNRCTLSIGDVTWKQDATFTFSQSCIDVIGTWDLVGSSTFEYTSSCTSHITNFGVLYVDNGMSFFYNPPVPNGNLIVMDTSASQFYLNSATLASTTTGMILTTGTLFIDGHSYIINNNAIADSQGVSFGNGNPADDLTIMIGANATVDILSGRLIYNNQQ